MPTTTTDLSSFIRVNSNSERDCYMTCGQCSAHMSTPSDLTTRTRTEGPTLFNQKDKITTTIFQTSPSSSFGDSLLMVTSSPNQEDINDIIVNAGEGSEWPNVDNWSEMLIKSFDRVVKGCHLNGTIYAEGSAVMSTSFCEYCYCIRSKRMCIRPRCHLSILGCLPRYTSEYACCPTSYVCGKTIAAPIAILCHRLLSPRRRWSPDHSSDDYHHNYEHNDDQRNATNPFAYQENWWDLIWIRRIELNSWLITDYSLHDRRFWIPNRGPDRHWPALQTMLLLDRRHQEVQENPVLTRNGWMPTCRTWRPLLSRWIQV